MAGAVSVSNRDRQSNCVACRQEDVHETRFAFSSRLTIASTVAAQDETEHLDGYAEWRQGTEIIVDGQRVRSTAATKFKGSGMRRTSPLSPSDTKSR